MKPIPITQIDFDAIFYKNCGRQVERKLSKLEIMKKQYDEEWKDRLIHCLEFEEKEVEVVL